MVFRSLLGKMCATLCMGVVLALCLALQGTLSKEGSRLSESGTEVLENSIGEYNAVPLGLTSRGLETNTRKTTADSLSRTTSNKHRTDDTYGASLLRTTLGGSFHSTYPTPESPYKAKLLGWSYIILIRNLRI